MMRVSGEKIVSGIVGTHSLMCFEVCVRKCIMYQVVTW